MGNKTVSWLSVVAIVISVATILLVVLKVEPIDINFFGGLVAVLSLLVIVVTWFQLSKGLSEEARIKDIVNGQVNATINQSLNVTFGQISNLHKSDMDILDLIKGNSEVSNDRYRLIVKLYLTSEIKDLNATISSIKDAADLLSCMPVAVSVIGHVNTLLGDIDKDEREGFIVSDVHPVLGNLREAISSLHMTYNLKDDKKDDMKDVLSLFREAIKPLNYIGTESLIRGIYRLFNLDKTDESLPVLRS